MTNNLKDMLNNIPVPDEIDDYIEIGLSKADEEHRRRKSYKPLLAIAASLVILLAFTGIVGFDRVEAAIRRALQYVPGYNVVVDTEEGRVLALKDQVMHEEGDYYLVIKAASKLGKNLSLTVESNYEEDDIYLKDGDGNISYVAAYSRSGGGEFWEGDFYFEVENDDMKNYFLLFKDLELPFTLEKTAEVEDFLQLGNHASDKGVNLVAIKKQLEDKLMISLLHQTEDKYIEDYPFEMSLMFAEDLIEEKSMYILTKDGKRIYPSLPSSFGNLMSDFYFDIEDQEGLKLVLPYLKVRYYDLKSHKIKIKTPKDGEREAINEVLSLGDFSIEIVDVRRSDREVVVAMIWNSPEDEILDYVRVRGIDGYGIGPNEETGHIELFLDLTELGRNFTLYFESPSSVMLGDWVIDLD